MSEEEKDANNPSKGDVSQHSLTKELAMKSLDTLGFHPLFLRHAFLSMNLSHNLLEDISLLGQYTHLVYLDISYNQVKTLKPLESIPALTQLRARGNALGECLDYSPACCQAEHSWATGQDAVGSMLTLADLRENQIESLRDLSDHFYLECLLLSQNQIKVIDGLSKLRYLQTLDLAHNQISVIEGLDNLPIRELDLSHNDILSLEGLQRLPCLSALKISHNNITTLAPLRSMNTLTFLDVGHNVLANIRQVEFLKEHSYLQSLVMTGNPCFEKAHYRLRVVYRLPNLKTLDRTAVSYEEKVSESLLQSGQFHSHSALFVWLTDTNTQSLSLSRWRPLAS